MKTKPNRFTRFLMTLAVMAMLILSTQGYPVQASSVNRAAALGNTFVVNSTADLTDADQGDNICAAANGSCTLRAAIMQANFLNDADTIILPAGVYTLTRPGDEDAAVLGDLDVINDLTIQGAGSARTIIDGNGAVTNDRVFQILSSVNNFNMSGVTIRNGKRSDTFGMGGGLSWDGGGSHSILLNDVVFDSNSAKYGGGLSLNYATGGSVELDNVVLSSNSAGAAGAGLIAVFSTNLSAFVMQGGKVYNNTGANQGGGIELEGTQDGVSTESIQNVEIYGNKANFGAGIDNYGGTLPYHIDLLDSYVHDNQAAYYGGGINNYSTISMTRTTLSSNSAGSSGGGLYTQNTNSIHQVQAFIDQSTFNGNTAQYGGGIYSDSTQVAGALTTLTDSTLSGNIATHDGGGVYVNQGEVAINSSTLADNQVSVPSGDPYQGMGGGLYATSAIFLPMEDSLIAGNTHLYGGFGLLVPDDCFGPITSNDYNLIQTTTNCQISNEVTHNIYGEDPLLGGLSPNGGPTFTQLPSADSPVIDAGASANCLSASGVPLLIDQRGFPRVVGSSCDIGAVERGPIVFLPLIRK